MKEQLFELAMSLALVGFNDWYKRYEDRELKETPWDRLPIDPITGLHHSQRSWMIYVSEDIVKPHMGRDYFGQVEATKRQRMFDCYAREYQDECPTPVYSDGGFEDEIIPLTKLPDTEVIICRLHRKGCNFDTDSRDYLYMDSVKSYDVSVIEDDIENTVHNVLTGFYSFFIKPVPVWNYVPKNDLVFKGQYMQTPVKE
tara:strand:- start:50703 stop:51299 length:597 start_codon:yes stop_codon:yes gene_type:complete